MARYDGKYPVYGTLSDCTKFCQCSNGIPYLHDCPEGLHFNSHLNVCDWPENAACAAENNVTEDNENGTTDNGDGSANEESTTEEIEMNICVQNGIECPTFDEKYSNYGALPDCTKYCQCSNGIPYSHDCPRGLHFNSVLNICDWPDNAGCVSRKNDSDSSGNGINDSGDDDEIGKSTPKEAENNICLQNGIECPIADGIYSIYGLLSDCTKFCQCSNGIPYSHDCPAGLHFNSALNVCDWPEKAGCSAGRDDTDASGNDDIDDGDHSGNGITEEAEINICLRIGLECPTVDDQYPYPLYRVLPDCTKFCQCSNGIPHLHNCPMGLHFNSDLNICDWPENAGCAAGKNDTGDNGNGTIDTGDDNANDESTTEGDEINICLRNGIECPTVDGNYYYGALPDCTKYCQCSNGIPYSHDCPGGLHFNSALNVCDWPENAECATRKNDSDNSVNVTIDSGDSGENGESNTEQVEINICLQNGIECATVDGRYSVYGALSDCTKFCQCSNGIPHLHDCPKGLHFNSDLNVCDWSEDAGCATGKNDTDESGNSTTDDGNGGRYEETTTEEDEIDICFQNGIQCPVVDGEEPLYVALPDCTKFCQCSNGIPHLHKCPLGLHFNPDSKVCDWPRNANCFLI